MPTRKRAVRIPVQLTPEQRQTVREIRQQVESERDEIIALGRELKRRREANSAHLRATFEQLKAERQAQGVTLGEIEQRTGIGRGALSRLENDPDANPSVRTLQRYAQALGKQIVVSLVNGEEDAHD